MNVRTLRLPQINGGLNTRDPQHKIDDSQSPDMLNMWARNGVLCKRWGQEYVKDRVSVDAKGEKTFFDLDFGAIHSISPLYEGFNVIHGNDKLYKVDLATGANTAIETVANAESTFLLFSGLLYFMDGADIWEISADFDVRKISDDAEDEAQRPYKPIVYINCKPDMSESTASEAFNLIGAGFRVQYNGDGTSTTYKLPIKGLDTTAVRATVGGADLVENTGFTVNRTNGTVTFAIAPVKGTNNVIITAYKTQAGFKERIVKCKVAIAFGGESADIQGGTRVFVMKNPNPEYSRTYWYSDLGAGQSYGMKYFPDTQYEHLLQNNEPIMAAAKQGGELIIFKTRSLFAVTYEFDGQDVYYPLREFNSTIGCDMPGSVQLIDNSLVFANTYGGVFTIVTTAGKQEENVKPVSANINMSLLHETNLAAATSVDYDRKYWLCVGSVAYVWDYEIAPFYGYTDYEKAQRRLVWFKFANIDAAVWHFDKYLYYAARQKKGVSKLVRFIDAQSDFGSPIEAYWISKAYDFGLPNYLKTVLEVYPSLVAYSNSAATITVSSEQSYSFYTKTVEAESFSWRQFSWAYFTWAIQRYAKPCKLKPKMKNVVYCQVKLHNNEIYRDMGISDFCIDYIVNNKIKR